MSIHVGSIEDVVLFEAQQERSICHAEKRHKARLCNSRLHSDLWKYVIALRSFRRILNICFAIFARREPDSAARLFPIFPQWCL